MTAGMKREFAVTPETKLGQLLDAYPDIERALLELSPQLAKLKNPFLRKTVAKVATLRQVAQVGKVPLATLINTIRSELGLVDDPVTDDAGVASDGIPDWLDQAKIAYSLDARPILESAGHPLGELSVHLQALEAGTILELLTPFYPAPLVDKMKERGHRVWSKQEGADLYKTYIFKL
jgi:uncharacterized protein (DUF2249 family)